MTAENRLEGAWLRKSPNSSNQSQEKKPRGYFNNVVSSLRAHAKYLESKGIQPPVLVAALHDYVLKHSKDCKVSRSDQAPYSVTLSYGADEAVVYGEGVEDQTSQLQMILDAYAFQGLLMLQQVEDYAQRISQAASGVKEIFVSKEEKCFERVRQYANQASRTSTFEELLTEVTKQIAEDCPDARVETNKVNDIFVIMGDRTVRVFTNDTYPYPDEIFPAQSQPSEKPAEKYFDPNYIWD